MPSDGPTTSNNTRSKENLSASQTKAPVSPAKPYRRSNLSDKATAKDETKNKLAKDSLVKETKQTTFASAETKDETTLLAPNDSSSASHTSENTNTTLGTGIISKIKDLFKLPFNSFKTQHNKSENETEGTPKNESSPETPAVLPALRELRAEQKKIENQNILNKSLETTASGNNTPTCSVVRESLNELKTQKRKLGNQRDIRKSLETNSSSIIPPSSSTVLEALTELRTQQEKLRSPRDGRKSLGTYSSANSSLCSTPTNSNIPNYQRGSGKSANIHLFYSRDQKGIVGRSFLKGLFFADTKKSEAFVTKGLLKIENVKLKKCILNCTKRHFIFQNSFVKKCIQRVFSISHKN